MKNFFLYAHGGSGNHGCEAIVRSTLGILQCKDRSNCTLISKVPEEDAKYGIDQLCTIIQEQDWKSVYCGLVQTICNLSNGIPCSCEKVF